VRVNRLKECLGVDGPILGAFVDMPEPRLVEFYGLIGFDWVLLDAEHAGLSAETCYGLVRAADAVGVASVIRVPANRPEVVLAYAETGAHGIIAPHIDSREAAEALVAALAYPPRGTRGAAASSRAANYGLTQTAETYFGSDGHAVPIALLEDVGALAVVEEIAGVPGLDVFCIGPGDLAASFGAPGQSRHPEVVEMVGEATEKLLGLGKVVGTSASTLDGARDALASGCRFLVVNPLSLLVPTLREFLSETAAIREGATRSSSQ
jgi:4-hydroxy-2-oxoheptanedioate aldolase